MNVQEQIRRLERFTGSGVRQPMGRQLGVPTVSSRIIELEQELNQTRQALRDALALLRLKENE